MSDAPSLRDQIAQAIDQNRIILFMKGTPDAPRCGFSARAAGALEHLQVEFASVDILPDARIRQELSALSDWPTIPQLFVDGELVGGSDIIMEMYESGELQELVGATAPGAPAQPEAAEAPPIQIENRLG